VRHGSCHPVARRGPDNEPLITQCTPVAEVALSVIDAAADEVHRLGDDWGSMRRA
jgi:hypothetical protein